MSDMLDNEEWQHIPQTEKYMKTYHGLRPSFVIGLFFLVSIIYVSGRYIVND